MITSIEIKAISWAVIEFTLAAGLVDVTEA